MSDILSDLRAALQEDAAARYASFDPSNPHRGVTASQTLLAAVRSHGAALLDVAEALRPLYDEWVAHGCEEPKADWELPEEEFRLLTTLYRAMTALAKLTEGRP